MNFALSLIINALVLLLVAYIVPGFNITSFWTALLVAIVLGLVNALIRPLLIVLTLPINILTLGLFTLVINAVLLLLVASFIPGFTISGLGAAILGGLLIWIFSMITNSFGGNRPSTRMQHMGA